MTDPRSTFSQPPELLADLVSAVRRGWRLLTTPPVPDYQPAPGLDPRAVQVRRLERVLDLLESTRRRISEIGWVGGGWMVTASQPTGGSADPSGRHSGRQSGGPVHAGQFADAAQIRALLRRPTDAGAACLIGSMLLLADDPDTAHSIDDVWSATDALYEAVHETAGRVAFSPGHVWSPDDRRHHLRVLTGWNDQRGRTTGDVIDLLNRSISRTIAACVA